MSDDASVVFGRISAFIIIITIIISSIILMIFILVFETVSVQLQRCVTGGGVDLSFNLMVSASSMK